MRRIGTLLKHNPYPGRGIVLGLSKDGTRAFFAYFIMGRSANSRNRVFRVNGDEVSAEPLDASLVKDPSLIIYSPVKRVGSEVIVTNGNHTDTVAEALKAGRCFRHALMQRTFEPDPPLYTPRIAAILHCGEEFFYELAILKCPDRKGRGCDRHFFTVEPLPGVGHFIHTYRTDGNPPPSFKGEPIRVTMGNDLGAFAHEIWTSLNGDNKISLVCRALDLRTGDTVEEKLYNKYE